MAYTTPRTWVDGELVTAAIMNAHVRDNLNASAPHLIVRKAADEPVAASVTFQDDDDLKLTVGVNEIWLTQWNLIVNGPAAADVKVQFTFPSGTVAGSLTWIDAAGAVSHIEYGGASPANGGTLGIATSSQSTLIPISLVYIGGGSGGTLQLQWAQATASGTTNMKAQSTLYAVKLA